MPYAPLSQEQVKRQRRQNAEIEGLKWGDYKKAHYALLRERLPLCEQYVGETVAYEYDERRDCRMGGPSYSGTGTVTDVKIEGGGIVYILDTKPRGIRRDWLTSWEIVEQ